MRCGVACSQAVGQLIIPCTQTIICIFCGLYRVGIEGPLFLVAVEQRPSEVVCDEAYTVQSLEQTLGVGFRFF